MSKTLVFIQEGQIRFKKNFKPNDILIVDSKLYEGKIFEEYKIINENQIEINNVVFNKGEYIKLNENLTPNQERRVKELISKEIGKFLWNLYTKRSIFT